MKVELLQNSDNTFLEALKDGLEWADTLYLGVAYASYSAFEALKDGFHKFLRNDGKLRALFDIEEFITEKRLIEELATIPGDSECKVFITTQSEVSFPRHYHPKFYLFCNRESYRVIVGSSNFTQGGIEKNIECNLSIYNRRDELFVDFQKYFDTLWSAEYSINVLEHGDLLDVYQQAFQRSVKEDETKARKLQTLRKKVLNKSQQIVRSKKNVLNEDFAYLLGLLSANSEIDFQNRELVINLKRGLANKGKPDEGYYYNPDISNYKISQYDAHKRDVERITEKLKSLFDHLGADDKIVAHNPAGYHFEIRIKFNRNSIVFREIEKLNLNIQRGKITPFVPEVVAGSNNRKLITSFLRGYCDLKSRISVSDGIYEKKKGSYSLLRMGISFPSNDPELLEQFVELFRKIGVEKGKGLSVTDPTKRTRENLIRIDVRYVPYELVGTH